MATVNFVGATNTDGPFAINGYYPLYATEANSNTHDGGNGTSHLHVFFGQNFYMPNGLRLGSTYFHGDYDGSLTAEYNQSATTNSASNIKGYYYYKLDKNVPEYHNAWKFIDEPSKQRIITSYSLTQVDIDAGITEFFIGCYPDIDTTTVSGYDIIVTINATPVTTFTYGKTNREGFIEFNTGQVLQVGDFIEISASAQSGLISTRGPSKYELPLSWGHNTTNEDILSISAPEYMGQFTSHIENQKGFSGEALGSNNYIDTNRTAGVENDIVQTNQDTLLGAFLVDDQPGNLVDALRFNSNEYVKFKNRLKHEIEKFYVEKSSIGLSNEYILEQVLRNVTSFKIGEDVFNKTYILPFGDNYTKEDFTVTIDTTEYVLSSFADLDKIENSLLVYLNGKLLVVEKDYTITSFSPLTISLITSASGGDTLCTKLYNSERDSAQCPPTPSTMGILPLYQPAIETDTSFKTPISTLIGHDGSRQKVLGDARDDILLEYETRIYNSAKAEFRTANSLPAYNSIDIRCGAFRETGYAHIEFYDLIRHYFSSWSISENLDPIANEFYNIDDEWSWNYSNTELPGHWRGWYEYHYDTVRPNTHPWEMLGFTEKPLWWDEEYYVYTLDDIDRLIPSIDYGSGNTKLWGDLEEGIIRQGPRQNTSSYKINNPYRRIGLSNVLPIDSDAKLISPYKIKSTDTTTIATTWVASEGSADSTFAFRTNSFRKLDGINVTSSNKLYVESNNVPTATKKTTEQVTSFVIPKLTTLTDASGWTVSPQTKAKAIAVLVNGDPLMSIDSGECWETDKTYETSSWIYNKVQEKDLTSPVINKDGVAIHYTIGPDVLGLTEWDSGNASPIVGWAFDGLPIYGPYGYSNATSTASEVVRIQSGWEVDTRTRGTGNPVEDAGPGGKPTGQFINDFKVSASAGASGFTDSFNMRYAVTKDSNTPIWHYVTTIDANSNPVFPYHVGGGIRDNDRWAGNFKASAETTGTISSIDVLDAGGLYTSAPTITISGDGNNATATAVIVNKKISSIAIDNPGNGYTYATATVTGGGGVRGKVRVNVLGKDNSTFAGTRNQNENPAIGSIKNVSRSTQVGIDNVWKLGDGAPVENAFKYSSIYPFAIAEALLLAKPGRFATVFSDPVALERPAINNAQLLSKATKKRWKFLDSTDFKIHGDVDVASGKMITNIGYSQFINSWLKFQGLDTVLNFVNPLRTLNVKLAHRMSGFVDRDTLSARTDQYSNDGNATSLIIPQENITTTLHSSNYKTRNFYTGVIVEKTKSGFRLRGFDKNRGYFDVYDLLKTGRTAKIEVGGEPESFSVWEPNVTYSTGNIVQYRNNFYQAPLKITSGSVFDAKLWQRLAKLPQIGSAEAVHYLEKSNTQRRVSYESEFKTVQEVFDVLIGLGLYQQDLGFDFGEYNTEAGAVQDWAYSAKQFLFWTTGEWQIGNTIELSPLASKIKFVAPRGFIAKINRTDREQFSILNENGAGIDPSQCDIIREDDYIEVSHPVEQIYSLLLYTKEVEHALIFDNTTDFSDVIYNQKYNQRHKRIKVKGQRTNNWKGKFLSQGFVIDGSELLPNLDNLAESLGRYHEFGFIPVEKQVYEASRALFGYTEKDYLTELDIQDEEQFDFYRGMIQGKGTSESLGRIARSSAVLSGNVNIFDEWALRVGDFGDTENNQSIELKLVKSDIKQDPQLITLDFPENVTNIVERIDIIDPKYAYEFVPTIEIAQPPVGGVQATAIATIDSATSKLQKITVTNAGSGYGAIPVARVLASDIVISSSNGTIPNVVATTSNYFDFTQTSASIIIADNLSSNAAVTVNVTNGGSAITTANVLAAVNENTAINANVQLNLIPSEVISGSTTVTKYTAQFVGKDFYLESGANFGYSASNVHYQPVQRYAVSSAMAGSTSQTTIDDVEVLLNDTAIANSFFSYDAGSVNTNTTTATYPSLNISATRDEGNILYPEQNNNYTFNLTTAIDSNNLEIGEDGDYKFVDLYIGNVLIKNSHNAISFGDHDNNSGTADQEYITANGTMYTIAGNGASITFPDISRLPDSVKSVIKNPPTQADADGEQQQLVKVLPVGAEIRVLEHPTVQLDASLKTDVPGTKLNIRVTAQDGIAVRMGTKRSYLITEDDKTDNTILIDIDDAERFIKKPTGVKDNNLWPTTTSVDASGIRSNDYPTIRNAGYVNSANINFQAFDVASIPELYSDDILIKPTTNDLIHVAKSENQDWNVYKLEKTRATVHYLERMSTGVVNLITDDSLFQYLDTNEIGQPNTGQYLDYVLSLDNADVSTNVVVWNQEDVVSRKQSQITDFTAPQMVQARIKSIGPRKSKTITAVAPHFGKQLNNITLIPQNDSDTVVASGDTGDIEAFDAFELVDGVGVVTQHQVTITGPTNTNELTVDPIRIESIAVTNAGSGYTSVPRVSITNSSGTDHATAVAQISGPIGNSITVVDGGSGYVDGAVTVVISPPENVDATTGLGNVATATATVDGTLTAGTFNVGREYEIVSTGTTDFTLIGAANSNVGTNFIASGVGSGTGTAKVPTPRGEITGITVTSAGSGYTSAPAVTIIGDNTEIAVATATLNASVDSIVMVNKGSGYSAVTPSVTFTGGGGSSAAATPTKTVPTTTPLATLFSNASNDATQVLIKFLGQIKDSLEFKLNPARTSSEEATLKAIQDRLNKPIRLNTYNTGNGTFTLKHDSFAVANFLTNLETPGFEAKVTKSFTPSGANFFTVASVGFRRFEFQDITSGASIGFSNGVTIRHLNKSKVTINDHGLRVGDVVRVFTNTFAGVYKIEQVVDNDNIVIKAPYIPGFSSGSVYGEGIEIKTVGPHGISPIYAQSNKTIAVHFADPKSYNQRYIIDYVTPQSIYISGRWAPKLGTAVYYEHKVGTLTGQTLYNGSNESTATNIVSVTSDVKLNEVLVTYSANSKIVPPQFVTVEGDKLYVSGDGLPAVTSASTYPAVEVTVARQRGRGMDRYPLVTTVDHDMVNINGSQFKVDNTNSARAVESSINRAIKLRREHVRENKQSGVEIGFVMMNDPNTPVFSDLPSKFVSNYGAYVNDKNLINKLSDGTLTADRQVEFATAGEQKIDNQFNTGPDNRGPLYGLTYTDQDTGIYYVWDATRSRYMGYDKLLGGLTAERNEDKKALPHNHLSSSAAPFQDWYPSVNFTENANELDNLAYKKDDVVRYEGKVYKALADIKHIENELFEPARWTQMVGNSASTDFDGYYATENESENDQLIPKFIPGNATSVGSKKPGVIRMSYDMEQTRAFTLADSSTIELPHFRLQSNSDNIFEIYQAVQNDGAGGQNGQVYYILLDLVNPELIPAQIDFYATVNAYNNFGNIKKTGYYYVNEIVPTIDASLRITNTKDPIRISNTASIVEVPPVEPAVFIGLQTIEEPFAVSGGNGSDAVANYLSIPGLTIDGKNIEVDQAGFNDYFMWVPGLTPGEWRPTGNGPGFLPGVNGNDTNFGYGRGYYALNDTHLPDDYPNVAEYYKNEKTPYNGLMPRFMYSKKFTVSPPAVNYPTTTYTDADGNIISHSEADILGLDGVTQQPIVCPPTDEDTGNTLPRPEEIFVACFWSEPFTYQNQLVGLDYSTLNGAGQPTPIYDDYEGTVVRVKYIRLTELPGNAYTQRLLPDTGWAGRGWNNRVADSLPEQPNEDNIFDLFNPIPVVGGGTDSDTDTEVILTIGEDADAVSGVEVNARGQLADDLSNTQIIEATEKGPILNGEFLNNMPGPCATLPQLTPPNEDTRSCDEVPNVEEYLAIDNKSAQRRGESIELTPEEAEAVGIDISSNTTYHDDFPFDHSRGQSANYADTYDNSNWSFVNVRVAGNNALRVYFDFLEAENSNKSMEYCGVVCVQSDEPYFSEVEGKAGLIDTWIKNGGPHNVGDSIPTKEAEWWSKARVIESTQVSGLSRGTKGDQVSRYGNTTIGLTGNKRDSIVDSTMIAVADESKLTSEEDNIFIATSNRPATNTDQTLRVSASHIHAPTGSLSQVDAENESKNSDVDENASRWLANDIGVRGIGFVSTQVNCSFGEYITVFFRPDAGVTRQSTKDDLLWQAVVQFTGAVVDADLIGDPVEECLEGHSTPYASGGVKRAWQGRDSWGYFGQHRTSRERFKAGQTSQRKTHLDNIYFPYQKLPQPYNSNAYQNMPDATWGEWYWCHNDNKYASYSRNQELAKRTISSIYREDIPKYHTKEIKGYFRAPYTGRYMTEGYCDDGIWAWISSEYTSVGQSGKPVRKGVDDLAGLNGDTRHEYFKEDGFRPSDNYNYHRQNAVIRTGWLTTDDNDKRNKPGSIYVDLEGGKYYFMRVICGNNKGPGYYDLSWTCIPANNCSNFTLEIDETQNEQNSTGGSIKRGKFMLSGRACSVDNPSQTGGSSTGGSNTGGGNTGGGNTGGGSQNSWTNKYATFATDSQALAYEEAAREQRILDGRTTSFSGAQLAIWRSVGVQCPPGSPASCSVGNANQDTPGVAPGYDTRYGQHGMTRHVMPDGSIIWIPNIDIYEGIVVNGIGNSTTPGQRHLSGFNFMPYSMKLPTKKPVIDVNEYSFTSGDLDNDSAVSGQAQRVSGGLVIPFAKKLKTVSRTPYVLKSEEVRNEPWAKNLENSNDVGKTTKYVKYNPKKIGSTATINGKNINNITTSAVGNQYNSNGDTTEYTGPAFDEPGVNTDTDSNGTTPVVIDNNGTNPLVTERQEVAFADVNNILFNQMPVIEITPRAIDNNGNYYNGGPTASTYLRQPTPETSVPLENLIGIDEGTELLINGRRIVKRGNSGIDIKTQINCANMGVTAEINEDDNSLSIISCNQQPFKIGNGCGGGTFKQVGDFHINRGFDQNETVSETFMAPFITPVSKVTKTGTGNATVAIGGGGGGMSSGTEIINDYRRLPDGNTEKFFYRPDGQPDQYETPARIPLTTKNKSTGGSNYRVGDRLRLIGGTPEKNVLGPLNANVCIDFAGAGYTNPANLSVVFNESTTTPGVGGAATVTKLDENGGIAEVVVVNQGAAYDPENPPVLTVKDSSPIPTLIQVDASWTSNLTLQAGQVAQINRRINVSTIDDQNSGDLVEESRFVRAVGAYQMGQSKDYTVTSSNVSKVTGYPNTVKVQFTRGTSKAVRPESYVKMKFFPGTSLNDYYITVNGAVTSSSTFVVDSVNDITGKQYIKPGMVMSKTVSSTLTIQGYVTNVNTSTKTITLDTSVTLADGDTVYFVAPQEKMYWVPRQIDDGFPSVTATEFYIQDSSFKTTGLVTNMFGAGATITVTGRDPWYENYAGGNLVDTIDPRIPKQDAKLTISVGDPKVRQPAGALRVAKFIVTDVDNNGSITGIRIIDRGLYKEFPSDLTMGIPLEYDYALEGAMRVNSTLTLDEQTQQVESDMTRTLGYGDPVSENVPNFYGGSHPEYQYTPFRDMAELALRNRDSLNATEIEEIDALVLKVNQGIELSETEKVRYDAIINKLTSMLGYDQGLKHPDFEEFPEFYFDGQNFQLYLGSPGAYDPTTFVCVDLRGTDVTEFNNNPSLWARKQFNLGNLIRKTKVIETDPKKYNFGRYNPEEVAGGTGARVFLTAQEIPNCSERGRAKEQLGLPDQVSTINAPKSLARNLNNALRGAGYSPDEASAVFTPIGELGEVNLVSTVFDGFDIDSPNPGTLEKIGLPIGDYNNGMLCITAILEKEDGTAYSTEQAIADIQELYDTNEELGLLTSQELAERYPGYEEGTFDNSAIMTIICAEVIQPATRSEYDDYGRGRMNPYDVLSPIGPGAYGLNDNNSLFGDGAQNLTRELFSYTITDIFGGNINLDGNRKQNAPINYFASKRFNERNVIEPLDILVSNNSATRDLANQSNAWVDSYSNVRKAIIDNADGVKNYDNIVYNMPNYVEGGWAYLENGVPKRWQTPLVDVNFITNAIVYDPESGNKINNLDFWDPFKGVLPGYIQNEISFISEKDPVSYNNARTNFGRNNVGKVWWDTSTIAYNWYEQGTDAERNSKWGSAFPGSQVTVCEWVESKAKPSNWSGNGTPRWSDKFVTERREDPKTGEYVMYYYYWVMNRTILDNKVKSLQGRKLDIRTIARYIADPVGYGLDMISFASEKSMLLHNISDIREEESHLQINLSRNLNPEGISHTAWKLMREGDTNSTVPEHLSDKLIDSLCGENAEASPVPDPKLSDVEKYGISFRPRQTMFQDIKSARRIMVSVLNRILSNIRVNSEHSGWDKTLPTARAYLQTVNWYAESKVDPVTNESIKYNDSLKPIFNVTSVSELDGLSNITDGSVVQVKSNQNDTEQLWRYNAPTQKFILVSVINDTVQLPSTIYTDTTNPTLSSELRLILTALRDNVFTNTSHWNEVFFELMKHAYMEQKQLSWAFKTSYLYVEKEENDLTTINGFRADNFQKVLDYMNEVKPYSAKVREYKDGKKTPVDLIGQNNISDYDKPPFVDLVTGTVRILDEDLVQDKNIMSNSKQYIDYVTATADGLQTTDPIRRANTTITFDRTNYLLTESNWDVANVSLESSIGYNIANLSVQTKEQVSANASVRAADKLFKFDEAVQAQFIAEVNTYYNDVTAARNTEIVGNGTVMAGLVASGQLKNTLGLIKDKVGGNFRGETLDASKFSSIIDQADYMSVIQTDFGFDSDLFDENTDHDDTIFTDNRDIANYGPVTTYGIGDTKWDNSKQIVSYEGVFDAIANPVTLRRSGDSYDGFDGVTFQRVAYGEERPEELALLDPLESVIFTVTTSDFSRGAAGNVSVFDELDTGNATLFHPTTALREDNSNVVIVNAGVGYKAPTVTITDAYGNNPTTTAVATASVNAAGSVQSITVSNGGAGYTEINLALTETLTETTSAIAYIDGNTIPLVSASNVIVGQIVTVSNVDIGEVASINGTTITLNDTLESDISSGQVVNFRGQNFAYSLSNLVVTASAGVDPDDADNFFAVDSTNGWDSATQLGAAGSYDTALTVVQERVTTKVSPNAKEVTYRMHHSLFGDVDYLRISGEATTKLAKKMTLSSTSLTVDDDSFLPNPTSIVPGSIWVGDERIQYGRRTGKVLSALTRGAFGTTPQDHAVNTPVYSAEQSEHFNHLNPASNVWLDTGTRYGAPQPWDSDEWDEIESSNIATSDVGVTITNVTSTTATLTLIGTGTANIALNEGVRVFANSNVSLFEVVEVTANNSSVFTVTASKQDTLDTTLFVNNGTATLRNFVYGAQGPDDDYDSAEVTGQSAMSLADRGNADLSNVNSIMKFLHKL